MNGKVMVVTSGKGGVGKTTAVANIGCALARRGKKVALVDADIGLRNLDIVLGLENRIVFDIIHAMEGRCRLRQALIKDKRVQTLYLLPAAQSKDKEAIQPEQMKQLTGELRDQFDYVILDCPAGIERGFKNAIVGADDAIIITTPEVSAVRDADRIVGLLEAEGIEKPKLVINRIRPDMVKRGDMLDIDDVLDILAIDLLGVVPDDESVITSTNKGEPAVLDGASRAGEAFRRIAARLEGEDVPFLSMEAPTFWGRIKRFLGAAR
ncbi:MAG: septum site-determining protein MinD [Bacillota bacterium]|jgi:septum site-determining protein MinD|nr:septum site-determining protein MinD [Bacillota bacterium]MDI9415871.1 septum site-determining protein MinD [Bacillota bacterium]NLD12171.1 septum site-determining protein MinD [Bacillota bacterium]HOB88322.1 septum site-determining protein MinD [Bacillota bacterium]HOJ57390.1 septum site-determining protein MinD [Bacillota bacterium]